jgi:hypothetical protein
MKTGDYIRTTVNQFDNNGIRRGSVGKILEINNGIADVEFDFVTFKKISKVKLNDMKLFEKSTQPVHIHLEDNL